MKFLRTPFPYREFHCPICENNGNYEEWDEFEPGGIQNILNFVLFVESELKIGRLQNTKTKLNSLRAETKVLH